MPRKNKFLLKGEFQSSSGSANPSGCHQCTARVCQGDSRWPHLVENEGYTVDYNLGVVTILDEAALSSNTPINVSLESESYFNTQRKTLLGTNLEYDLNDHFSFGGTLMHLNEKPLTTKVSYGEEPISNTIWGRIRLQHAKPVVHQYDKMLATHQCTHTIFPYSAVDESAQLILGHASSGSEWRGCIYIDDFEGTSRLSTS